MFRRIALAVAGCLVSEPAIAQDAQTFATIAFERTKTVKICPTTEYRNPWEVNVTGMPFFEFNGTYKSRNVPIPGFTCQMIGPFKLNGENWYLQNVRGLIPPELPLTSKKRTNAVRICSAKAKNAMAQQFVVGNPVTDQPPPGYTPIYGPFEREVGGYGCEKLWGENYTLR